MTQHCGITKRLWLHMPHEGGYWDSRELCKAFEAAPGDMMDLLRRMRVQQQIAVRAVKRGKVRHEYGVTPGCRIPLGVTLEEIGAAS